MIPEARGRDGITPPSTIRGTLDRDSLIQIARAGGGDYFELGRQDDREIAFSIIGQCLQYRFDRYILRVLVGQAEYDSYTVDQLTYNISYFSLDGL